MSFNLGRELLKTENELSFEIIGSAIEVHRILGPGLLESAYEECLCYELKQKRIEFDRQLLLPMNYKNVIVREKMYRLDIWVEKKVIVDVKSVEEIPLVGRLS
ncbi:GxxExxY protein [Candidatus Saccharibacteria bacterium]|nr:GxxExxY protein [Candidatus Saccharibacteria bacterium]